MKTLIDFMLKITENAIFCVNTAVLSINLVEIKIILIFLLSY